MRVDMLSLVVLHLSGSVLDGSFEVGLGSLRHHTSEARHRQYLEFDLFGIRLARWIREGRKSCNSHNTTPVKKESKRRGIAAQTWGAYQLIRVMSEAYGVEAVINTGYV